MYTGRLLTIITVVSFSGCFLPRKFVIADVPWPLPFLPSICVHNNTRERKTSEKQGRPGSIHHVSGCEVDVGKEGPIFKNIRTNLEREFLTSQDE